MAAIGIAIAEIFGDLTELWGLRGERTPPPLKPGDTVTLTVEGPSTTRAGGPQPDSAGASAWMPRSRPVDWPTSMR